MAEDQNDKRTVMAQDRKKPSPLLVDERTAAEMLSLSESTLTKWRLSKPPRGPRAIRIGPKVIRYRLPDLLAFVNESVSRADVEREQA